MCTKIEISTIRCGVVIAVDAIIGDVDCFNFLYTVLINGRESFALV